MNAFAHGAILGLTITLSFGPGFLAIFQTSIGKGFFAGFILATGILMSDLILISISYFGLAGFIQDSRHQVWLGFISGTILIASGIFSWVKKSKTDLTLEVMDYPKTSFPALLMKGFLLNIANPFSLIFWLGMMGLAAGYYGTGGMNILIFIAGVISTAFGSDILKCYFSGLLKNILSLSLINQIEKIASLIMVFIGTGIWIKVMLLIPRIL